MKELKPKFRIGDEIAFRTKYGEHKTGEITGIEKTFQVIDPRTGKFKHDGLATLERTIENIVLPYRYDGTTLEVDYPEERSGDWTHHAHTTVSKLKGFSYTVKAPDYNYIVSEEQVKKL